MTPLDKILKGLKQQLQPDLLDEQQRQQEIESAVEKYLKKWGKTSNQDELYHSIDKLAERLVESGLDSLPLFKLAWERNPQDKVLLLKVSQELLKRGIKTKEAINIYRAAAEVEPNKFPLLEFVANYYRENNFLYELMLVDEQIVDTFEEYEKIVQNGSEDEKLKLVDIEWVKAGKLYEQAKQELLPLCLMAKRKDKRAMALYRKALEEDPENIEVLELLTDALLQQKCKDAEALEIYEYYLAYKPDSCEVILLLSQAYRLQQRETEAIALLEAHYRSHPQDVQCLEEIVNYYLNQPETNEKVLAYFKAYLKTHPKNTEVLKRIAEFYADIQQCDAEAVDYYRRYLPYTKEPSRFLSLIAHYSFRNERWHEAIEVFEKLYKSGQREKNIILPLAS
ncbi:MAG: tetratricopeptide repeat protein, partial [Candidatus Sumerlaeia bacterium]|nr:tetratricopeptide repeat protein [Candidatus Sumerlaeia bacterium]